MSSGCKIKFRIEEIKDLLNAKFSKFGTRLTSLEQKLGNVTIDIHLKLNAVENTVQESSTCAPENGEEIEGLKFRLTELNETVSNQAIHQLDIEVEDLKNRSLRKTLFFRNIKKQQSEKTWDDTKMVLANEISKNMQHLLKEEMPTETPCNISTTFSLLRKLQIGTCREKLNLPLLKLTRKVRRQYLSRRCTRKSLTERRNAALKYQADLNKQDPSIQGYVKLPAILMIKRTGERKYSLEKEF